MNRFGLAPVIFLSLVVIAGALWTSWRSHRGFSRDWQRLAILEQEAEQIEIIRNRPPPIGDDETRSLETRLRSLRRQLQLTNIREPAIVLDGTVIIRLAAEYGVSVARLDRHGQESEADAHEYQLDGYGTFGACRELLRELGDLGQVTHLAIERLPRSDTLRLVSRVAP
jgi:HAMP domain-containing protein